MLIAGSRGPAPFEIGGERFGLLLCVPLQGSELAFARQEGTGRLTERLEGAARGATLALDVARERCTWAACANGTALQHKDIACQEQDACSRLRKSTCICETDW